MKNITTLDVQPLPDTSTLREAIRSGDIKCECHIGNSLHYDECLWADAIRIIYEVERQAEALFKQGKEEGKW